MMSSYQENGSLPPILSPTIPQKHESTDDVPLSMLSPTLPSQFTLDHPAPKRPKPHLQQGPAIPPSKSKVKVRWINRLDQVRPRFMLRMNFEPDKYRRAFEVTGLGITSADTPANEVKLSSLLREASLVCEKVSGDRLVPALADYLLIQIAMAAQEKSGSQWNKASELSNKLSDAISRLTKSAQSLKGISYMVHAVITRQEISVLKNELDVAKGQEKIIDIQRQLLQKYDDIEQYLKRASRLTSRISHELSNTVGKQAPAPPKARKTLEPTHEQYIIPLTSFSSIGEACGLLYLAVSEISSHQWKADDVKVEI